jgi:EKC/KEOPS complex subunit CGI121/TPRKB
VKGIQVAFDDELLGRMTSWANVRKYYKLGAGNRSKVGDKTLVNGTVVEDERRELEIQILGAMALRGAS